MEGLSIFKLCVGGQTRRNVKINEFFVPFKLFLCLRKGLCHRDFATLWSKCVQIMTKGAFFWEYSGIGLLEIDGIYVLLGAIPFSE